MRTAAQLSSRGRHLESECRAYARTTQIRRELAEDNAALAEIEAAVPGSDEWKAALRKHAATMSRWAGVVA